MDAEFVKNPDSYKFWMHCMHCPNYIFPLGTINDHMIYQTLNQSNSHYDSGFLTVIPLQHV